MNETIKKILDFHKSKKIRLNSLEGYVRQIIGWREFMRGIYQNYDQRLDNTNFFNHKKKMKKYFLLRNFLLIHDFH